MPSFHTNQGSPAANRATELLLPWDPAGSPEPLHHQLATAVRTQIVAGRLRRGDRLPPSRVLAEALGVSRWVVTEAYEQLGGEGYLTSLVGSGTVVSERAASVPAARPEDVPDPRPVPASAAASAAAGDLWPVAPDLASFPRQEWRAATLWALKHATAADLGHSTLEGAELFRTTMSDYLRRVRGLDLGADEPQVTSGTRHAVALVCRVLHARGVRRIAVEDPGWPRVREIAEANGVEVVPVPVDEEGLCTDRVDDLDVGAVFVSPAHQFPMGVALAPARRRALLAWAEGGDRLVVEDDFDAEFRYDRRPLGALAALGREHVVYLGSSSKILSPSLHLGWAVVPHRLRTDFARARLATGALVPTLEQLTLARLVLTGSYDKHLRRMRKTYLARRRAVLDALDAQLPGALAPSMDAGLHVVWWLPDGVGEQAVLDGYADAALSVAGLSRFRSGAGRAGLVIGYGNCPERHATDAVSALAAAARRAGGRR